MFRKVIGVFVYCAFFAIATVYGQYGQLQGIVSDVHGGDLLTITGPHNSKFQVLLQGIETPDENQELFETVEAHVRTMVVGKAVQFNLDGLVYLNGVDLSAQLLRDGAGWYIGGNLKRASAETVTYYENQESKAKEELRGIWAFPLMRPTSELKKILANSSNPFDDSTVVQAAWNSLGPAVESVFGPEVLTASTTSCSGRVVDVVDGDTVKIANSAGNVVTVRLKGIDAPERNQDFGRESRVFLSQLVLGKTVSCEANKTDRYGRTVGKLILNGRDLNLEMVKACYAWHYADYAAEQAVADKTAYSVAESEARTRRCGLFAHAGAIRPQDFRKRQFLYSYIKSSGSNLESEGSNGGLYPYTNGSSGGNRGGSVQVKTYIKKDGTVVKSYTRSAPKN